MGTVRVISRLGRRVATRRWLVGLPVGAALLAGAAVPAFADDPPETFRRSGERIVTASVRRVLDVLTDFDNYTGCVPLVSASHVVRRYGPRSADVFTLLDMPWPVPNRWVVFRVTTAEDESPVRVSLRMLSGDVRSGEIDWLLEPLSGGRTRMRIRMLLDPNLPLPDSWLKGVLDNAPIDMLQAIAERSSQPTQPPRPAGTAVPAPAVVPPAFSP